ncbi:MAG: alkaline phosphatase family protein [Planctomycetales bacterium]|nr:alkaline phosphatase family protein [Planctomycetales bacterium]
MPTQTKSYRQLRFIFLMATLNLMVGATTAAEGDPSAARHNVILVTIDGLRWQDVFRGADERLLSHPDGGVKETEATREAYWRDTATQRRATLMPFLWREVAIKGQLFGNRDRNSKARVLNDQHFSYPGYSEILCGYPDPRITSNDKIFNPNITVLEWLARRPGIGPNVAAFCSWDVFPYIINIQRSGLPVNAGWTPIDIAHDASELAAYNRLMTQLPRMWSSVRYDAFTAFAAKEYLRAKQPRLLYMSLGEPDDWAHAQRYDLYLDSILTCDRIIEDLWQFAQSLPQYRDNTSLIITVDHGRGDVADQWTSHKISIPGSDQIWIAALGPNIPASGERTDVEVTQSQVAATVAHLLGEDYAAAVPEAGRPLPLAVDVHEPATSAR